MHSLIPWGASQRFLYMDCVCHDVIFDAAPSDTGRLKGEHTCHGYRQDIDLLFKDQTLTMIEQATNALVKQAIEEGSLGVRDRPDNLSVLCW